MLLHDGVAQLMKPTRSSFSTAWLSWGGSKEARSKDDRTVAASARDERPATASTREWTGAGRARRAAGDGARERTGAGSRASDGARADGGHA